VSLREFDTLPSTNQYCELLDLDTVEEFTVVWAHTQSAGIGQRGNRWESEPGANLTFSLILKPRFLDAAHPFRITQTVALGLSDMLKELLPGRKVRIKWPNDIYVDGGKICGTLIVNKVQGTHIESSVCGIGLNVNQTRFPDWIPNPVSLCALSGRRHDLHTLLDGLIQSIRQRYRQLQHDGADAIDKPYLERLLHYRTPTRYAYQGHVVEATIHGVDSYGRLLLARRDGTVLCCQMKEISLLPPQN